jgi:tripartite-type tricarboxylate transporter receptor subunit TctC
MNVVSRALSAAAVAAFAAVASVALAQPFPDRPIQLYVPVGAGGFTDTLGRSVAQKVSETLGQPVVVVNNAAGGGIAAAQQVARATPNGYTLMLAIPGTHVMNIGLRDKLPYDPVKDFDPVALLAKNTNIVVASPSAPFDTIEGFIQYAKEHPGKLFYGSTGVGSTPHLAMELLKARAGIDVTHVPFASSPQALTALQRGDVQVMFDNLTFQLPHIKAGAVKAIAGGSPKRNALLPNVPAVAEAVPGFDADTWYGVVTPAGTAKDVVQKLAGAIQQALKSEDVRKRLEGAELGGESPEQFAAFLHHEREKWVPLIKRLGIRAE